MDNEEKIINGKYVVECVICGHIAGTLYQHLKKVHSLSTKEYRNKYGSELLVKRHSAQKGKTKETDNTIKLQSLKLIGHDVSEKTRNKISKSLLKFNNSKEGEKNKKVHSEFMKNAHRSGRIKTPKKWIQAGREAAWKAYREMLNNESPEERRTRLKKWIEAGSAKNFSKKERKISSYILSNYEYAIELNKYLENYNVDIYIAELNLVIEFYGDYWHCNPNIYDHTKVIRGGKHASDIWKYDEKKQLFFERNGYAYEIIWEHDYINQGNTIIDLILEKYQR